MQDRAVAEGAARRSQHMRDALPRPSVVLCACHVPVVAGEETEMPTHMLLLLLEESLRRV